MQIWDLVCDMVCSLYAYKRIKNIYDIDFVDSVYKHKTCNYLT